jgi:hypothetical protein
MRDQKHVLAIGGIGGSGTRIGAAFLQILGYYIGDDLNEPLDNLWLTLLFKRRSILLESKADLISLTALFFSRMSGRIDFSDQERELVFRVAHQERLQHRQEWLLDRANPDYSQEMADRRGTRMNTNFSNSDRKDALRGTEFPATPKNLYRHWTSRRSVAEP